MIVAVIAKGFTDVQRWQQVVSDNIKYDLQQQTSPANTVARPSTVLPSSAPTPPRMYPTSNSW